ncbi:MULTISPECIES: chitinase [Streptomyces]|uniref:Sugar hydrolase n=1 Tax=Streptomyces sviceus (strain ATCC 29083 / DSM 924 / JCM 4929 / NBRC 13980 / NCIMB 11184 / NRRL 5439 / UC 5370) TaxID=463191 RepID=B5HQE4_STRX2|nr:MULTISPECIES: chitinase [Streptomyces]EDY55049.1 sugar hydrolase [Streptomyces sviceus ATCC 29083]MYT07676.1 hydrolase [Streptomyces sp. SID5470]
MRGFLRSAAGFTCLFALAATGCSAESERPSSSGTSSAGTSSTGTSSAGTSYAPYVSATEASDNDSAGSPSVYNLAFVIADGTDCTPSWNGTSAVGDSSVRSRISALKKGGAEVRVSFGGASGKELAETCSSAAKLAAAYGKALDAAGSSLADFDIEGDALTDSDSVDLRSQAIALLQKERSDLAVSFTLPVMPSGLDDDSVALLESANNKSVQVSTVNIMTMNYGESYDGDMGSYAITSAKAAQTQLKSVFGTSDSTAWRAMALTSMIGTNDVSGETFTLSDAAQVREFAASKEVAWVSMWSTFRDQECESGNSDEDDPLTNCSGVSQDAGAFGEALSG